MKYASALVVLGSAVAVSAQGNSLPPSIAIPFFAQPSSTTVIPITFATPFGTVPAGFVTYLTQPVQPTPAFSTAPAPSLLSNTLPSSAPSRSMRGPSGVPRSSTSRANPPTTSTTPQASSAPASTPASSPSSQTGTNAAAGPMMTAVGVPAAVAVAAGLALF